jgi:hypothetical protein
MTNARVGIVAAVAPQASSPTIALLRQTVKPIGNIFLGGMSVSSRAKTATTYIQLAYDELYNGEFALEIPPERLDEVLNELQGYVAFQPTRGVDMALNF